MNIREKILVIEDEKSIARFISTILTANGYEAMRAASGAEAMSMISSHCPDLVILDLGLPDMDGLDILRQLRSWSTLPVVVVSARSHEQDKVSALDLGADDYLTKPFEPKELLACVRMLTRRQPEQRASQNLEYGDLRLETDTFQLSCGERSVRLSRKEFDMLELLMRSREMVLTKENLILKLWGYESDAEDNNVEVYISFLRKKLDYLHSKVKIRTIRMVGYRLEQET